MQRRAEIDAYYRYQFAGVKGIHCLPKGQQTMANHSYFPILVQNDYPWSRDALYQKLKEQGIHARRYFYPLISDFPMYRGLPSVEGARLLMAAHAAEQVLCLPIYPVLNDEQQERIVAVITGAEV